MALIGAAECVSHSRQKGRDNHAPRRVAIVNPRQQDMTTGLAAHRLRSFELALARSRESALIGPKKKGRSLGGPGPSSS